MSKQLKTKETETKTQTNKPDRALRGKLIEDAVLFNRELEDLVERFAMQGPRHIGQANTKAAHPFEHPTPYEGWHDKLSSIMREANDQILRATIFYEDRVFFPEKIEEER